MSFLLDKFPAKGLHVAEWEVVVNAIAQGPEMLKLYLAVDPQLVEMNDERVGDCFGIVFALVEDELQAEVVQLLLKNGADPNLRRVTGGRTVLKEAELVSTPEVVELLKKYDAS